MARHAELDILPRSWAKGARFVPMALGPARQIADHWKYPVPYDFYDATADPDDYGELVCPDKWPPVFDQALRHGELVGFCSLRVAGHWAEIALGLRPDLTGRGLGEEFVRACVREVGSKRPAGSGLKLSVAAFNRRAITVYERAGFVAGRTYMQETNGGLHAFVEMVMGPTEWTTS